MKLNTNAMKLNTNANEYIPESIKEENKKYDKLEKDFENENKWMFDIVVVDRVIVQSRHCDVCLLLNCVTFQ